jgi:hypothetical protein
MQACGIKLKQVGGDYRGHCPFHEDTMPSLTVNPKENLGTASAAIKAVERLRGYFPGVAGGVKM